jgi:hypothetical protein
MSNRRIETNSKTKKTNYRLSVKEKSKINEVTQSELDSVEKFADKALAPIDVDFTYHFLDRVTDPRNGKAITVSELVSFFKRLSRYKNQFMEFLRKYSEFVTTHSRYDINIPFVRMGNKLVAKTIMRNPNFLTSNPKFKFENIDEAQAVSGGKVHKFITGTGVTIRGKKYPKVHYELMGISNTDKTVKLKVLAPKELFGQVVIYDFRSIRRGPFIKTDTSAKFEGFINQLNESEIPKGKWIKPKISKERGEELVDLVQTAYRKTPEGSFINSVGDLAPSEWLAKDFNDDPKLDVTIFYRKARANETWAGFKIQGVGHNGSDDGKKLVLQKMKELLGKSGFWVEASDALEHVLYKTGAPYVKDEGFAQKVFPKTDLKMTGNRGQYTRKLGSKTLKETIFGNPKLK